jgi:exodeoxyribonuclease V beta subunit
MHLLVLAWGPAHDQEGNPLHPLLFSQEPLPTVGPGSPDGSYQQRSDAEWRLLLEQEFAERGLPIELLEPSTTIPSKLLQSISLERSPLSTGPVPRRSFDTIWGRSSYTSWTHGSHGAAPEALEEGRETDGQSLDPDLAAAALAATNLEVPNLEPWDEQGPLATFPRGANAGDCLHRILEQLDYQQPAKTPTNRVLVERELQRSGIATTNTDAVILGIEQLLGTPFGGPLGNFQLNQLALDMRLNELNFDLTIGRVTAERLQAAFANHPGGSFGTSYANSLGQLAVMSEGFLTGSIDLVFRAPGPDGQARWWVADWKSNWMGERDNQGQPLACGPRHYGPAAMVELMAANHYPLQAHLYLVALHRYLGWRLPHYKPEQDLGGYAYVFLRGAPGDSDAVRSVAANGGLVPGMFLERAPLSRVLALDHALARPPEASAA